MKATSALFFFFLCFHFSSGQYNLIADSSFEHNKVIPLDYSGLGANTSWNSPTRATTDLFCKCNKKDKKLSRVNVPSNGMGIQEAHSGNCYAGFFAISHGIYREYLQTALTSPMEANKEYILSMYLSLSDYSRLAVDRIGVCFLNKSLKIENSDAITNLRPLYIPIDDEVGLDTTEWHQVTVKYKAKGGENHLLIGSFAFAFLWQTGNTPPDGIVTPINRKIERDAYYYIDDVSIYEYKPEPEWVDTDTLNYYPNLLDSTDLPDIEIVDPTPIEKTPADEVITFRNLLFQTGEAVISPVSYNELNTIAMHMKADPKLNIEIYGHTDNSGDPQKNKELSLSRAIAVGDYLKSKGIDESRIKTVGYGSEKPIASNDTPEGRLENRRVEFILKSN